MTILRYTPPVALWAVGGAILTNVYGPLSVVNPFRQLLSMVAAVRFLVEWLLGPGVPYPLLAFGRAAALETLAGFFGLAGWFALLVVIFARYGVADI